MTNDVADGATATDPTASAVTVTVTAPLFPSLVPEIVAVPGPTPVTTPLDDTVATALELELHDTTRPVSGFPLSSFGMAVSVAV